MIDVVYAMVDFPVGDPNGSQRRVWKGSHWPADDPVVQEFPDRFTTDPRYGLNYTHPPAGFADPPVEQATAAPGERRATRRAESRG
jgi:hypothetical protein